MYGVRSVSLSISQVKRFGFYLGVRGERFGADAGKKETELKQDERFGRDGE